MQTPAASAPHDLLTPLDTLENNGEFIDRHIGPTLSRYSRCSVR